MTTTEERLDRLESLEAIRDIVARYAIHLDERDLDALVGLFVEDVKATATAERGRGPLKEHYEGLCRRWGATIHCVFQQAVDFESADRAMGHVYCRAEHEIGDRWVVATLRYLDRYERRDGRWYFRWRRTNLWYVADMLERPLGDRRIRWPGTEPAAAELPAGFPLWEEFYTPHAPRAAPPA